MTKIIYTEKLEDGLTAKPVAVAVHDEYWDFAEFHLNCLRDEKPELMNALLLCGEMGAYLNLLGKLNATLKDFYLEEYKLAYGEVREDGIWVDEVFIPAIEENAEEAADILFFYEEDQ